MVASFRASEPVVDTMPRQSAKESFRGPYCITETIRDDGWLRLVRAKDADQRDYAVYELDLASPDIAPVRARLTYETERLAAVDVAGIRSPVSWQLSGDSGQIVCPWIDGQSLAKRVESSKLAIPSALSLIARVLTALQELHVQGLTHLALRPRTIFLLSDDDDDGPIAVGGLGPLVALQSVQSSDSARRIAAYAAPEVLGAIDEDVCATADLYSLGIVLFELLSGQLPFRGNTTGEVLYQHLTCPVPDLTRLNPAVPGALNAIVQRLLRKDPRDRYQSAAGVLLDVNEIRTAIREGRSLSGFVPGTHDHRATLIEPSFVGRSRECAALNSELELARAGSDRTALLTAPSGIGKSRLLLEVSRSAARRGFRVLRGLGQDQVGLAPLSSLQAALAEVNELVCRNDVIRRRVIGRVSSVWKELATALPQLAEKLGYESSGAAQELTSDRRIAFAVAQVLASCGTESQPLLLMVDDAQWVDDLTLAVLHSWNTVDSPHTMLIVSSRPTGCSAGRLIDRMPRHLHLELGALDRDGVQTLLQSMAGELPSPVVETVWGVSEGNPFAAAAVLRGLVEGGTLTPEPEGWQFDPTELHSLQMNGQSAEVLTRRLERLAPESLEILEVGAVLGRDFSLEAAASIAGISEIELFQRLEEPRRLHLLWVPANGGTCAFLHDQIRAAVQSSLPVETRRRIHRRAADHLVRCHPDEIFRISSHYYGSGRPDLARPFALRAAEQARTRHSLEIAEEQYRIVLDSCECLKIEPDTAVLQSMGDVLMLLGRYSEAAVYLKRAAESAEPGTVSAQAKLKLGELAFKRDEKDTAIELWEEALGQLGASVPSPWLMPFFALREIVVQILHTVFPRLFVHRRRDEPAERDRLLWRLHSRLAYGYWYVRGKAALLWVHLRGMNLAERYRPTPELAQAWSEHGPAMTLVSLNRRGIHYARKSLRVREEMNDMWGQGQSLHFLSIVLYSASQFRECIEVGRRSVRILDRAGDHWEKLIAQYQVAASHYRLGEFEAAVSLARDAYQSGLAIGEEQVCGDIVEVWARAAHGDIPARILERELGRSRTDVQGIAHVLLAESVRQSSQGSHQQALDGLNVGIRTACRAGVINTYTSPLFAWRATVTRLMLEGTPPISVRQRRVLLWRHRWSSLLAIAVGLWFRNELPHALREHALSLAMRGCVRRSEWLLRMSLRVARRQEAAWEDAQSALALARLRAEWNRGEADDVAAAESRVNAFVQPARQRSHQSTSLSLADRFDTLLNDGRRIACAVDRDEIVSATIAAARRMLRSDFCRLMGVAEVERLQEEGDPLAVLAARALAEGSTRTFSSGYGHGGEDACRSGIATPISVQGAHVAVLVAANSEVTDLFGKNEIQIANYIATITGAALENADSFRRLQGLNTNLEKIIQLRTAAVESRSTELQKTADDLRRTQDELVRARDAAESANQSKSAFLAHMSHEIRTPIGAVLGFAELLATCDGQLTPQQREHVERIQSNGQHLLNLLNDLLDISRIEAGELSIESIECQPWPLLHDVMTALQSRAMEKGLSIRLTMAGPIPARIATDPTRLRQIITNLVGNAIKFTAEGGVLIETRLLEAEEQLRIRITDTGVGISDTALESIFQPFRQADNSVTRRYGGTGLGLAISRRLARALGGEITVSSCPGEGSTFDVTIATGSLHGVPRLSPEEADATITATSQPTSPTISLQGLRVLVADDIEENRRFVSTVLERAHALVTTVCDGQEAIQAVESGTWDIILMDMQMPVLDGYAATSRLRAAGCTIPILALTANGMRGDAERCLEAGCTGYVSKPVSISGLLRSVAAQIAGEFQRPERSPAPASRPADRHAEPSVPAGAAAGGPSEPSREPDGEAPALRLPDDPFFAELALSFLTKVDRILPKLARWAASGNSADVSFQGHWMKGTGGTVGLDLVSSYGRRIDDAARDEDLDTAARLIDELAAIVGKTLRDNAVACSDPAES